MLMVRGVRGAITADANTAEAIHAATTEVLREIVRLNGIQPEDVASVLFTTTPDLNAAFPAKAARDMGWHQVALMGFQEMDVPDGVKLCIRVLVHWNTTKQQHELEHVYLKGAVSLRPELSTPRKK
ncbi:chorismate mutase [Aggregatilineales bacterium SYSU G02658]